MSSDRIKGFDGLRAIAFLLVFVSHKIPTGVTDRLGSVAVWLFFVLSGFLITRILGRQREGIEAAKISQFAALSNFYRGRILRIFPPYYALLVVLAILAACGFYHPVSLGMQRADWFFYSNIYIERHGWEGDLGHLWSLAVEQQYYALFAPIVLFLPRRWLPGICAGLLAVSVGANGYFLAQGRPQTTFDVNSIVNIGLFGFGGLAGIFAGRPLPRALLNAPALILVFGLILLFPILTPNPLFIETCRPAVGLLAACLLVQISQTQNGMVVRALDFAPFRLLGVISYAAYLFHPVIHSEAILNFFGFNGHVHLRGSFVMDLAITVILASLSWILLERPLIQFGRARRTRRSNDATSLPKS
ncbi:acyltransferase [Hyphomicrobium sp.]|uniref:acyltransferase family protein n=1 Tax=Hyphomicrobium sp. TaxID=82 RepID=UPI000FC1AC00|nr:acyltransferase [Hyphomicrobium sp.]RUO97870.1 MAG: acyltransferase [Hyphomicrobium sp.]